MRFAGGIEVGEFTHFKSTGIKSPAAYSGWSASATRNALARQRAGTSPEPCHSTGVTSAQLTARRKEAGQAGFVAEGARQPGQGQGQGERRRLPGEQFQRGAREQLERHHGGRRITRQTEEKFPPRASEHQRLAGLNQHAVEIELRAELPEDRLDHVVFAGGDAAGEQKQIGLEAALDELRAYPCCRAPQAE